MVTPAGGNPANNGRFSTLVSLTCVRAGHGAQSEPHHTIRSCTPLNTMLLLSPLFDPFRLYPSHFAFNPPICRRIAFATALLPPDERRGLEFALSVPKLLRNTELTSALQRTKKDIRFLLPTPTRIRYTPASGRSISQSRRFSSCLVARHVSANIESPAISKTIFEHAIP